MINQLNGQNDLCSEYINPKLDTFVCLFVMKHSSIYSICYKFKIRNVPKLVAAAYWNIKSKHYTMDCSKELTETQLDDKCQFLADIEGICRL